VLATLVQGNEWLRSLLCTLARRGVALRKREPTRARALLDELSVYPVYKAGRFLFDLLELEDFMVDGDPPPILSSALDGTAVVRLGGILRRLAAAVDGSIAAGGATLPEGANVDIGAPVDADELPPLEAGYYLYDDVVLGAVATAGPVLAAAQSR
jgi:hypothetical protein